MRFLIWGVLVLEGCCFLGPTQPPPAPQRPTNPYLQPGGLVPGWWDRPAGTPPDGGILEVGAGEGAGFRPLMLAESFRTAGGGQAPTTRHLSINFRLDVADSQGRWPLVATIRRSSDNLLLSGWSDPAALFRSTLSGKPETGEHSFILCPTPSGVNIVGEKLRVDAWVRGYGDGGTLPDGGALGVTSAEFTATCLDCMDACGG